MSPQWDAASPDGGDSGSNEAGKPDDGGDASDAHDAASPAWALDKQITDNDEGFPGDQFGNSVALAGDTMFVGAPAHSTGDVLHGGAVWVFQKRVMAGAVRWVRTQKLLPDDPRRNGNFGSLVLAQDKYLVVAGTPL
ncbi:MAG TPA: FG-GAP repeat protein, partial [Polyangiaceae bacterium]|nr:FG-GAP repeat protein [Polyangiaceae bacterium]